MIKVISIDVDGVIVDILTPWLNYYNYRTGENVLVSDITDWNLYKLVKHKDVLDDFLKLPNTYKELDVANGDVEVLRDLSKDYKIQFVTDTPKHARKDRYDWLKRNFPFIDDIYFEKDKNKIPADLLIDDKVANLERFSGVKVCMDAYYNRDMRGDYYRVYDMYEFKELIYELNK